MSVRVNTKISDSANEWLDKKAAEMALTKSALINIAIENYIKEVEVVSWMPQIMQKLEEMGVDIRKGE